VLSSPPLKSADLKSFPSRTWLALGELCNSQPQRTITIKRLEKLLNISQIVRSSASSSIMSSDEIVWQVINQQFCSFKIKYISPDFQPSQV
jgi:hypothetical protein